MQMEIALVQISRRTYHLSVISYSLRMNMLPWGDIKDMQSGGAMPPAPSTPPRVRDLCPKMDASTLRLETLFTRYSYGMKLRLDAPLRGSAQFETRGSSAETSVDCALFDILPTLMPEPLSMRSLHLPHLVAC